MKIINRILETTGWCFSYIYPLRLNVKAGKVLNRLYTYWLKRHFCYIGSDVILFRTIDLVGGEYISIYRNTLIGRRTVLAAHDSFNGKVFNPKIRIGENVCIGEDSNICSCNYIEIGNGVRMGRKVMINDTSHGNCTLDEADIRPNLRPLCSKGPIVIGENVWIGEKVSILGNVRIGRGAIIATGAVVTKDIPEYSIAAGVPAKVVRFLS